jgi:hypothetical protein
VPARGAANQASEVDSPLRQFEKAWIRAVRRRFAWKKHLDIANQIGVVAHAPGAKIVRNLFQKNQKKRRRIAIAEITGQEKCPCILIWRIGKYPKVPAVTLHYSLRVRVHENHGGSPAVFFRKGERSKAISIPP